MKRATRTTMIPTTTMMTMMMIPTIAIADLPEAVRKTANERSKGKEPIKVEKVEVFNPPEQYYEVKWRVLGFEHELEINPDRTVRS